MDVRSTLKALGDLAITDIGFCVGIAWRTVTGSHIPDGMLSPTCRLASVLFTGYAPAYRFHALLSRHGVARLPRRHIRLVELTHAGQRVVGVAVIAVVSPDRRTPTGFRPAPPHPQQPGYRRFFQRRAWAATPTRPWWDHELGDPSDDDRFDDDRFASTSFDAERQATEELERDLDRIEAEYDAKLAQTSDGRRSSASTSLRSVQELFTYARRPERAITASVEPQPAQTEAQWLATQHAQERQRQQQIDADQAEIAAALHTPRRGRAHADDQAWLATEQVLKGRRGLTRLYRATAPRPPRPAKA